MLIGSCALTRFALWNLSNFWIKFERARSFFFLHGGSNGLLLARPWRNKTHFSMASLMKKSPQIYPYDQIAENYRPGTALRLKPGPPHRYRACRMYHFRSGRTWVSDFVRIEFVSRRTQLIPKVYDESRVVKCLLISAENSVLTPCCIDRACGLL